MIPARPIRTTAGRLWAFQWRSGMSDWYRAAISSGSPGRWICSRAAKESRVRRRSRRSFIRSRWFGILGGLGGFVGLRGMVPFVGGPVAEDGAGDADAGVVERHGAGQGGQGALGE